MSFTPACKQLTVMAQGHWIFPWSSQWVDLVQLLANTVANYDLAAARVAMGLAVGTPLFVVFGADAGFWFNPYAAAAIPSGNVTNGTSSTFSPNQRYIDGSATTLSFIAAQATNVSLQFYRT